jgi:hypothetical protein
VHACYAALGSAIGGGLFVARIDDALAAEERQMLQGMAQVLGLALRNLRAIAVVRARQVLLETLLAIQRANIPTRTAAFRARGRHRGRLQPARAGRHRADAHGPHGTHQPDHAGQLPLAADRYAEALVAARAAMTAGELTGGGDLLAAPVHVNGAVSGSLVAIRPAGTDSAGTDSAALLAAFRAADQHGVDRTRTSSRRCVRRTAIR